MNRNILLIGNNGQLGWELQRCLVGLGEITAVDLPEIDISIPEMIRDWIRQAKPWLIINAAAYTDVDKAESQSILVRQINTSAPQVMAEEARLLNCSLIHYSTDYVFDGNTSSAYTESEQPNPLNEYGRSKLDGERAVLAVDCASIIFRTSWIYSNQRDSFVSKVRRWAEGSEQLRIVDDQVSSPTWARLLAQLTTHMICKGQSDLFSFFNQYHGIFHLSGTGHTSRYEWARQILELTPHLSQKVGHVVPVKTSEFPSPARRPRFSALDCSKFSTTFKLMVPEWSDTLKIALAE